MKSVLNIDVSTMNLDRYATNDPFEVTLGSHTVSICLSNLPRDMTEALQEQKEQVKKYAEYYRVKINDCEELETKIREMSREMSREIATNNDSPRPPIADETLKEILAYLPGIDFSVPTNRTVLARLITGWSTERAARFVADAA